MSFALTAATDSLISRSQAIHEFKGQPRTGHHFEPTTERLLDKDLLTLSVRLPNTSDGVAFIREFVGSRGVADAVAVTGWYTAACARITLGLPPLLNETDCAIIAALSPNQTRTTATLAPKLGMSQNQLVRRIRSLTTAGYIQVSGSGYRRVLGLEPIGRAYALEAKVNDWRQGISQALRYSTWCDAAAIVLMKDPKDLDKVKTRCSVLNLGLAANGRWIKKPRIGGPNPGLRLAMSEQFIWQIIKSETL